MAFVCQEIKGLLTYLLTYINKEVANFTKRLTAYTAVAANCSHVGHLQ